MSKTIRVRAACVVKPNGEWTVCGQDHLDDPAAAEWAVLEHRSSDAPAGTAVFWLTAEIPVPEPTEIQAAVEEST